MSNEGFPNLGAHDSDPTDVEPVSVETKNNLIKLIKQKTEKGQFVNFGTSAWVAITLQIPGDSSKKFGLEYIPEEYRKIDNGTTHIATAQRIVIPRQGIIKTDTYKFHLTPDGTIDIEKVLTFHDLEEETRHDIDELSQVIETSMADAQEEKRLGMAFVSEKEANKLNDELKLAQPVILKGAKQ